MAQNLYYATEILIEADIESAIRAEELAEEGDHNGAAVWRRVINAIGQLVNMTPPGAVH